jgi:hypothetical protein
LIQPPINYIIIAIVLAILFFNRTSRSRAEKRIKEISSLENDLPDTLENKQDAVLPDSLPDDDAEPYSNLDASKDEPSEEDGNR